jgi:signal peptidase I
MGEILGENRQQPKNSAARSISIQTVFFALAVGILLGICLKLFVADILLISGQSMEPAIAEGSHIFVSKLKYGLVKPFGNELALQWANPQKNDIVIYIYNNKTVVKRCVAVEGDVLDYLWDTTYRVAVNERVFPLTEGQYQRFKHTNVVPQGMIFAIGDNHEESVDSRHYGFISNRSILGKVLCK